MKQFNLNESIVENATIEEKVNVSEKLPDGEYNACFVKVERSRINVGKNQFTNLKFEFEVNGKILTKNIVKHRGYISDIKDRFFIRALIGINPMQVSVTVPMIRIYEGKFYRIKVHENDFCISGRYFYDPYWER